MLVSHHHLRSTQQHPTTVFIYDRDYDVSSPCFISFDYCSLITPRYRRTISKPSWRIPSSVMSRTPSSSGVVAHLTIRQGTVHTYGGLPIRALSINQPPILRGRGILSIKWGGDSQGMLRWHLPIDLHLQVFNSIINIDTDNLYRYISVSFLLKREYSPMIIVINKFKSWVPKHQVWHFCKDVW